MLRKSAMYNLKVSTSLSTGPVGLLAVDPQGVTPRTPEILNSLMAMSHPLATLDAAPNSTAGPDPNAQSGAPSGSSATTAGSPTRSPPSLQHTRSLLIKEGLKLTLQTKRRHTSATSAASGASASGASADEDDESSASGKRSKNEHLTPEDEERRRRRRERNKVAATKCRIKKRERTVNLVQESEILESQNYELKSQIQELETQRRRLVDMLSTHSTSCSRQPPPPYNSYSPTTPFSPAPSVASSAAGGSDLGHGNHHGPHDPYGPHSDVLMGQYGPGAAGAVEEEQIPSYYSITKHEVSEETLLAGLDDPLDPLETLDVYTGYTMAGVDQQTYCRPTTLTLDTPVSTPGSTPGSLVSPHHGHIGVEAGGALSGGHYHQHQQHMMGSTPITLNPESVGVFGMDSGCMA